MANERDCEPRLGQVRSSGSGVTRPTCSPNARRTVPGRLPKDHAERGAKFDQGSAGSKVDLLFLCPLTIWPSGAPHLAGSKIGRGQSDARV
jgi:hypothetical protein